MQKKKPKTLRDYVFKTGKIIFFVSAMVIAGLWLGMLGEEYLIG